MKNQSNISSYQLQDLDLTLIWVTVMTDNTEFRFAPVFSAFSFLVIHTALLHNLPDLQFRTTWACSWAAWQIDALSLILNDFSSLNK